LVEEFSFLRPHTFQQAFLRCLPLEGNSSYADSFCGEDSNEDWMNISPDDLQHIFDREQQEISQLSAARQEKKDRNASSCPKTQLVQGASGGGGEPHVNEATVLLEMASQLKTLLSKTPGIDGVSGNVFGKDASENFLALNELDFEGLSDIDDSDDEGSVDEDECASDEADPEMVELMKDMDAELADIPNQRRTNQGD